MKLSRYIALVVLLLSGAQSFSQGLTSRAYDCYNNKDYACAQKWIDSAVVSDERMNSQTWQLRGVIYRKMETPDNQDYRSIAIESFVQARNLDPDGNFKAKIDELMYNTIIRYYNDAVTHLDNNNLDDSEKAYSQYKEKTVSYLNKDEDFKQTDIDYYNALGSRYMSQLELLKTGDKREKLSAKAIGMFEKVIQIDTSNWQANYNAGIIYYNNGADLAVQADPFKFTGDIIELDNMLSRSAELFEEALPYLHRAYRIDPKHIGTLEGLTGCYYGLNDDDNYNKFQKMLDVEQLDDLLKQFDKNPNDFDVVKELVRIYTKTLPNEAQYDKFKPIYDKLKEQQQ